MIVLFEDFFFKDNVCLYDLYKVILLNLVNMLIDLE